MKIRKIILWLVFSQIALINYGQIIADHTVVDKYNQIPQQYIDAVKKMLVDIAGESHSLGYRVGENLLEILDPKFQVMTYDGSIPAYSAQYLRLGKHSDVGEATFYTSQTAINAYKSHITNQNSSGNPYSVVGFGWCWDMTWQNAPGGGKDPIYNVRWAGSSEGGPNGNLRWGLDSGDQILTGNSVSMNTYLDAVEQYIKHCSDNGYSTKVIFTTGPVDDGNGTMGGTENGFQREIKHDYIRNYVSASSTRILFDYADILCWNNSGVKYITNWNDGGTLRLHANIHPDNMKDYDASWNMISHTEDGDHIGEVGALRLAKAMWWLLARIAGWDGSITAIDNLEENESNLIFVQVLNDEIRVTIDDILEATALHFYNMQGSLIDVQRNGNNPCAFNISSLPAGIYLIVVSNKNGSITKKVIIP